MFARFVSYLHSHTRARPGPPNTRGADLRGLEHTRWGDWIFCFFWDPWLAGAWELSWFWRRCKFQCVPFSQNCSTQSTWLILEILLWLFLHREMKLKFNHKCHTPKLIDSYRPTSLESSQTDQFWIHHTSRLVPQRLRTPHLVGPLQGFMFS